MITATTMLYLYVETPLHAGVGAGLSTIDLPIQRERTTQYPMIQGSGIKGKLRATAEYLRQQGQMHIDDLHILFGPPTGNEDHAGALIVGDARILLFPVRSLNGVFAYATSHDVLSRFKRDLERGQSQSLIKWQFPSALQTSYALVTTNSAVQVHDMLVLEDFSFTTTSSSEVDTIAHWLATHTLPDFDDSDYWSDKLRSSLVILPDNDFRDFVLYATEIITRVRIKRETKTVERGALWTEEYLPSDTLLYSPIYATDARKSNSKLTGAQMLEKAITLSTGRGSYLQLGGEETVGRGIVRLRWGY